MAMCRCHHGRRGGHRCVPILAAIEGAPPEEGNTARAIDGAARIEEGNRPPATSRRSGYVEELVLRGRRHDRSWVSEDVRHDEGGRLAGSCWPKDQGGSTVTGVDLLPASFAEVTATTAQCTPEHGVEEVAWSVHRVTMQRCFARNFARARGDA